MKKILTFALIMVLSIGTYAQNEHMKFMGIPLDGTINQFQQKLISKGFSINKELNQQLPKGERTYVGTFMGENARVDVSYDTKINKVFAAEVVYVKQSNRGVILKYDFIKKQLVEKYHPAPHDYEERIISDVKTFILNTKGGSIMVFYHHDEIADYVLHIQYYDTINGRKHVNSTLEDL